MTPPECAVCDRAIVPMVLKTDVPVVCKECYESAEGWPHDDLPRSEPGTVPDLYVRPLAVEQSDSRAGESGRVADADTGDTETN